MKPATYNKKTHMKISSFLFMLIALSLTPMLKAQNYDYNALIDIIQTDVYSGVKDVGVMDAWVR